MIELLIVIAIIAVLLGLLLSAVQQVREVAARTECANRMRQLGVATLNCNTQLHKLPPVEGWFPGGSPSPGIGWGGIFFHLLPYMEQKNFYDAATATGANPLGENPGPNQIYYSGASGINSKNFSTFVGSHYFPELICPSDATVPGTTPYIDVLFNMPWGVSCFAGNFLVFGSADAQGNLIGYTNSTRIPVSMPDGASNTILFAERYAVCVSNAIPLQRACLWDFFEDTSYLWGGAGHDYFPTFAEQTSNGDNIGPGALFQVRPMQGNCDASRPSTAHIGGIQVTLADGSVRLCSPGMTGTTWWAACTPGSADGLGPDW